MTGTPAATSGFKPKSDSKASNVIRCGIQTGGVALISEFGRNAVKTIQIAGQRREDEHGVREPVGADVAPVDAPAGRPTGRRRRGRQGAHRMSSRSRIIWRKR